MKALIFPAASPERLAPLTTWMPEYLLPIVNKPVVEHLLELLSRSDIQQVVMVLEHMPYETEAYFGQGERWGLEISYCLEKAYAGIGPVIKRVWSRFGETFLLLPANIVTDVSISGLMATHEDDRADLTVCRPRSDQKDAEISPLTSPNREAELVFGPSVMSPEAVSPLLTGPPARDLNQIIALLLDRGLNVSEYHSASKIKAVNSVSDYLEINRLALRGEFNELILPGKEMRTGVWIGRQTHIHRRSKLAAPTLLGNHCHISKDASIGADTIVGDNVVIDRGATIENSVILANTYIGSHTEVKESVVRKKSMFDAARGIEIYVEDDIILGDLDKNLLAEKIDRLTNLVMGLLLLLVSSPIWGVCYLIHLVRPSKRFFRSQTRYGSYQVVDLQGKVAPRPFKLYTFHSRNRLIRKLPGLINVIKGEMNIVGNTPLTHEQLSGLTEEWETLRFKAPVGLFHLWEAEGLVDPSWEEQLVSEAYYAASRTIWGDLIILLKSLLPRASRKAGDGG